jgi:hypothetical protein
MFDPSDDFAAVTDGLAPVTVTRPGTSVRTEVAHALRQAVRTRQSEQSAQSAQRPPAADVVWHLPAAELAQAPRPGDVILDADGTRWTILEVRPTMLGARWRCVARNLALYHGLDAYVDVEKVAYVKGSGGADEPTWHVWKTGLRAKIRAQIAAVGQEQERQLAAARFTVFLAEDLAMDHTHRIRAADGTIYAIVGWHKADRIDALMEIDTVRREGAGD